MFPDKKPTREWLENNRWNNKPQCPKCNATKSITHRKGDMTGYYYCGFCRRDFTVRIGTVMERSHIPLQKWLYAMYLITAKQVLFNNILENISQPSTIYTDDLMQYTELEWIFDEYKSVNHSAKHLQRYVNEVTFRLFKRREY